METTGVAALGRVQSGTTDRQVAASFRGSFSKASGQIADPQEVQALTMTGLSEPIPQMSSTLSNPTREEMVSVPPPHAAPGRVLFVSGPQESEGAKPLQVAGHEVCECPTLASLCFQLKYQQPDAIVVEADALGHPDHAIRVIRGRHATAPIVLLTRDAAPGLAPIRAGFYAAIPHPVQGEELMVTIAHAVAHHRMLKRIHQLEVEATGKGFAGIHGTSAFTRRVFRKLQAFGTADVHVLLVGEPGTGKSLAARAIHDHSARCRGPFIALSCGRLSDSAFSADAFINAPMNSHTMRQHGALNDADRGTLFLSDVEALSPRLQTDLLHVLRENPPCDFRLVASTSSNLSDLVAQQRIRPELVSHLSQTQLHLLPLRSRPVDVGPIAQALLDEMSREQGKPRTSLSPEALMALEQHPFQRNMDELREILSSALMTCTGTTISVTSLPATVPIPTTLGPPDFAGEEYQGQDSSARRRQVLFEILAQKPMKIRDLERCAIEATLQRTGDNVTQAMRELGIGRTTLYRKLKKYGHR